MIHHTKDKGDLGVAKVLCSLVEQGYMVLTPNTEHAPFDLVAYKDSRFIRIQVKYRAVVNGKVEVPFRTCWADKNGTHMKKYDLSLVDFFAIYCPDTNECYYVDPRDFDKSVTLRVDEPKNGQSVGVKWARDYRDLRPVNSVE